MQGYRTYAMENHHNHHLDVSDKKPIVVDLMTGQYGKPQTPPPSPTGRFLYQMKCLIILCDEFFSVFAVR